MIGLSAPTMGFGGAIQSLMTGMQQGQQMRQNDMALESTRMQLEDLKDSRAMESLNSKLYQKMNGSDISFDEINKNVAEHENRTTDKLFGQIEVPGLIPTQVPTGNMIQRQTGFEEYMQDIKGEDGKPVMEMVDGKSIPKTETLTRPVFEDVEEQRIEDKLPNEFLNRFEKDTGIDISKLSTEDQLDYLKNQSFKHGDKFGTYKTLMTGSSKFKDYVKDKRRDEAMKDAALVKLQREGIPKASTTKVSDTARFADLDTKENLNEAETVERDVLRTKLGINKDYYSDKVTSSNLPDTIISGGDYAESDVNQLVSNQSKAGQKYGDRPKRAKTVTNAVQLVNSYKGLGKLIEKYDPSGGIANEIQQNVLKHTSSEDFAEMSKPEQEQILARALKNTEVYTQIFNAVAAQSGAEVPEAEMARRINAIVGGDPSKINDQILQSAYGKYAGMMVDQAKTEISNISPLYKGDQASLSHQLKEGIGNFTAPTPATYSTDGGTKSAKEVALDTPTTVAGGILESLKLDQAWEGFKMYTGLDDKSVAEVENSMVSMSPSDLADKLSKMDRTDAQKFVTKYARNGLTNEQLEAIMAID